MRVTRSYEKRTFWSSRLILLLVAILWYMRRQVLRALKWPESRRQALYVLNTAQIQQRMRAMAPTHTKMQELYGFFFCRNFVLAPKFRGECNANWIKSMKNNNFFHYVSNLFHAFWTLETRMNVWTSDMLWALRTKHGYTCSEGNTLFLQVLEYGDVRPLQELHPVYYQTPCCHVRYVIFIVPSPTCCYNFLVIPPLFNL